tara:strand:- start:525 stop:689 length:165 start_codon:yes stop_codon:yes gene_type:complete
MKKLLGSSKFQAITIGSILDSVSTGDIFRIQAFRIGSNANNSETETGITIETKN